jgi:hypothetical protein
VTERARKQAETYVKESLEAQRKLGYSSRVDKNIYEAAVNDAARAVDRMLRAQRRSRVPA